MPGNVGGAIDGHRQASAPSLVDQLLGDPLALGVPDTQLVEISQGVVLAHLPGSSDTLTGDDRHGRDVVERGGVDRR